jgi:mercuric ion transport protein
VRFLMAAAAVVTCPCHLPILVAVLSGTALGALLVEHWGWALLALTALFVSSAWAAVHLFSKARSSPEPGKARASAREDVTGRPVNGARRVA